MKHRVRTQLFESRATAVDAPIAVGWNQSTHTAVRLTIDECAGQHIAVLRHQTIAAILPDLQGLVKVHWNLQGPTNIDQHKPIMAAANRVPKWMHLGAMP